MSEYTLPVRNFGTTGISVPAIGFGAGHIGDPAQDEDEIEKLLNELVELGITLFDTARSYGLSEERIGRFLKHRRDDIIISTKVGYGVEGVPDWTYDAVARGVDEALERLQTDWVDLVFLHSCPKHILEEGEVIRALEDAFDEGKIRLLGYSGENDPRDWALYSNRFNGIQSSINLYDQKFISTSLWNAKQRGLGIMAKRSLGNAPWRFEDYPEGHYSAEYWSRALQMNLAELKPDEMSWAELAVRFSVFTYGVDCALIGSTNLEHIKTNLEAVKKGPLPNELREAIRQRFENQAYDWAGMI